MSDERRAGLLALVVLAALTAGVGWGARDALQIAGARGEGGGAPTTTGSGGASCAPAGIRLCGDPCPEPAAITDCPGDGCTPVAHVDGLGASGMGICWPDIDDWVNVPCIACHEGEACAQRADGGLWCVSREVCDALYAFGETDVCRYADKTRYTGAPIASVPGCPDSSALCGGGCDSCATALGEYCIGRSATQPFGICLAPLTNDPTQCSPTDASIQGNCALNLELCASFVTGSEDQAVADEYGVCLAENRCLAAAKAGIVRCYDHYGVRVDP
jgi:hypothetical protein